MIASEDVAYRIESLAKQQGISINKLLTQNGLAKSTVSNMKSGRGIPTADKLAIIAWALGTDVFHLLAMDSLTYKKINDKEDNEMTNKKQGGDNFENRPIGLTGNDEERHYASPNGPTQSIEEALPQGVPLIKNNNGAKEQRNNEDNSVMPTSIIVNDNRIQLEIPNWKLQLPFQNKTTEDECGTIIKTISCLLSQFSKTFGVNICNYAPLIIQDNVKRNGAGPVVYPTTFTRRIVESKGYNIDSEYIISLTAFDKSDEYPEPLSIIFQLAHELCHYVMRCYPTLDLNSSFEWIAEVLGDAAVIYFLYRIAEQNSLVELDVEPTQIYNYINEIKEWSYKTFAQVYGNAPVRELLPKLLPLFAADASGERLSNNNVPKGRYRNKVAAFELQPVFKESSKAWLAVSCIDDFTFKFGEQSRFFGQWINKCDVSSALPHYIANLFGIEINTVMDADELAEFEAFKRAKDKIGVL